jgi:MFS family permease
VLAIFAVFTLASSTDAFLLLKAGDSGIPLWQIPLLWAFFNGVKAATGIHGGILADRMGHVRTILAGWTVYAIAYVGFAFVSSAAHVWGLFAFYALFYALTEGAERALVADLVGAGARGRAFGAFHASVGFASLPASLLFGIWWKVFGPKTAFLIGAALAVVAAAALMVWWLAGPGRPRASVSHSKPGSR